MIILLISKHRRIVFQSFLGPRKIWWPYFVLHWFRERERDLIAVIWQWRMTWCCTSWYVWTTVRVLFSAQRLHAPRGPRLTLERNSGILTSVVFHSGSDVLFERENETHGAIVRCYKKSHASYESKCDALILGGNAEDLHFFLFIDTVHSKRVRLVCIIWNSGKRID